MTSAIETMDPAVLDALPKDGEASSEQPDPPQSTVDKSTGATGATNAAPSRQRLRFDSANVKSTYCNVCNATSTREEVVINFGINKTWDTAGEDLEVQLEHRIILNPIAAKRLQDMLARLIAGHEQRYGKLN